MNINVLGNLPFEAVCDVCNQECSSEHGLLDFQCCWCQRNVHADCLSQLPDVSCKQIKQKNIL